jgi:hypothetical protein
MHLIDTSTARRPTIGNTWFLALIQSVFAKFASNKPTHTTGSVSEPGAQGQNGKDAPAVDNDDTSSTAGSDGSGTRDRHGDEKEKKSAGASMGPTVKAGGMRRKVRRR